MSKSKIAIIGAGNIALKHLEVLEKLNNISLVGITSRTKEKALNLAKKFKTGFYRQMQAFLFMIKTGKLEWPGQNLSDILNTVKLTQTINRH